MLSFFALLFRQNHIKRWGLMRSQVPESLSEHAAQTAYVAHALALIGNLYYGREYNPDRAASAALFHDVAEVFTGDLPTPVKYFSETMRKSYGEIERSAIDKLLTKLPEPMRGSYEPLFGKDYPEAAIVHAADKICGYIKALQESEGGNREFDSARKSLERSVKALGCEEADYFVEHFLAAFTLPLDEM